MIYGEILIRRVIKICPIDVSYALAKWGVPVDLVE